MPASELRMLVAAHIMTTLVQRLSPTSPDDQIKEVAEAAVKIAKALEEAVSKSLPK